MARLWKSGWVDSIEGDSLFGKQSGGSLEGYWSNLLEMGPPLPVKNTTLTEPPEMTEAQVYFIPKDFESGQ
jgi:hypothetical protein